MQISSKFTIAVHTLLVLYFFENRHKTTSEFVASSVNVNPVIIRQVFGKLKRAGLIEVVGGTGGARLTKPISEISLLDVFNAADCLKNDLFRFHYNPNPACPVGKTIHDALDGYLLNAQAALENELKKVKLSLLTEQIGII